MAAGRSQRAVRAQTVPAAVPRTGFDPWWTYEEDTIPGVGHYYVNVVTSQSYGLNLIVQADDMDVPNEGVDLAFRRTYNSQSQHDYLRTDGSQISNYGGDLAGTYLAPVDDASGHLEAYYWRKKSGTFYIFYQPNLSGPYASSAGASGRLSEICGRNANNCLTFTYSWDNGDASDPSHMNQLAVTTEAGQTALLTFANFNGRRLLQTLTRPGSEPAVQRTVAYQYDANGDLVEADEPTNNVTQSSCAPGILNQKEN